MSFPFSSFLHGAGRLVSHVLSGLCKLALALLHPLVNVVGAPKQSNPRPRPAAQPKRPTAIRTVVGDPNTDPAMAVTNVMEAMNLQGASYKVVVHSHGIADELPATGEALADAAAAPADDAAPEEPLDPVKEAEKEVHRAFMNEALDMVRLVLRLRSFPVWVPSLGHSRRLQPGCRRVFGNVALATLSPTPVMHVSTSTVRATRWRARRPRLRGRRSCPTRPFDIEDVARPCLAPSLPRGLASRVVGMSFPADPPRPASHCVTTRPPSAASWSTAAASSPRV